MNKRHSSSHSHCCSNVHTSLIKMQRALNNVALNIDLFFFLFISKPTKKRLSEHLLQTGSYLCRPEIHLTKRLTSNEFWEGYGDQKEEVILSIQLGDFHVVLKSLQQPGMVPCAWQSVDTNRDRKGGFSWCRKKPILLVPCVPWVPEVTGLNHTVTRPNIPTEAVFSCCVQVERQTGSLFC